MPRPSWLLVVNSVLFTAACLFAGGIMLSCFAHWDPCVWVAATIFIGPSFALAFWQYLVTFRANQRSAKTLCFVFLAFCSGLLLIAAAAILEPLASGIVPTSDYLVGLVLPVVLLASWFGWTSLLNFFWYKQLADAPILATLVEGDDATSAYANDRRSRRFSLRELFALMAALSIVLVGIPIGFRDIPPQRALHVSAEEARLNLPAGAHDVCVHRGFRGTIMYNFAIDEAGFWEWEKSRGGSLESQAANVEIKPITGGFTIYTCSDDPTQSIIEHTISRGWFYDWDKEDRGLHYAYDADLGRAYYSAHSS